MISESGSVEALMLRSPGFQSFGPNLDHSKLDRLDPMQNQLCRVCEEPAAGFHFGAFTCEGCKSFFGRTCNNQSVIQECKNNYRCVVDKKNRTACKACRLRKCIMVGMSKSGSRYGRRSNWFKIHCLMQQNLGSGGSGSSPGGSSAAAAGAAAASASASATKTTSPGASSTSSSPSVAPCLKVHSPPATPELLLPKPLAVSASDRISLPGLSPPPPASRSSPDAASSPASSPFKAVSQAHPMPPALPAAPSPLYPGFPFLPSAAAFPAGLAFHTKPALLSPLLAHSHLLQMAVAFAARPQVPQVPPAPQPTPVTSSAKDLMAEHRALLERFASSMAQAKSEPESDSAESPAAPAAPAAGQSCPMDLSSSRKSEEGDETDLNRNLVKEERGLDLCSKSSSASSTTSSAL